MKTQTNQTHTHERSEFTPGPWTVEVPPSSCLTTRHIIGPNREPVAAVGLPHGYTCGTIADVANARLIAAAPELLEIAKAIIRCASTSPSMDGKTAIHGWNRPHLDAAFSSAVSAIAKAEGTA